MNKFAKRLKELRGRKYTQKELAEKINVSKDSIYNWEKGRSEPSIDDLILLATVLDVTIDYLVGKDDI